MQLPREVIVGKGTIERSAEVTKKLGFEKSALIISGPTTYEIAGKRVENILRENGLKVEKFIVNSVSYQDVKKIEGKIKTCRPQVVLGVGGGTKIDVAKLSSALQEKPCISVPTTVSHDGIASALSSIKQSKKPYSTFAQSPIAVIADIEILIQEPWRYVISGCGDVISKFTATRDWKLAYEEKNEYYGEYAASLALMSARLVTQNASLIKSRSEEGVRVLLEALISCGVSMSIAGSSRPCSGSEHLFSHALNMIKPNCATHGEQCGLGTIMMAYLHDFNWKRIKKTLNMLGAPTKAEEIGVGKEEIIDALKLASKIRPERYTILDKLDLNRKDYKKIAKIVTD
jgi:glycerol-1-phosphate dehydrogenase [NAD(P)+]